MSTQRLSSQYPRASLERLSERFRLTESEAEIAILLSVGETVKSISRIRGSTVLTVRTQIKRAMHKMEVHRQVDLVRLVLQSVTLPPLD